MLNRHANEADIATAVREEVRQLREENGLPGREPRPEDRLSVDLGLGSLDLAALVASLEMRLDADPFRELVAITSVRTVGDLERAYLRSSAAQDDVAADDDDLLEVRRLAEARREVLEGKR